MEELHGQTASRGRFLGAGLAAADRRSFVSGYFALSLDGADVGYLKGIDGGAISGEVVEEPIDPGDYFSKKHIGNVKYEDFTAQIDFGMGSQVYDWIASTMNGNAPRKNGAITSGDFQLNAKSKRTFTQALVTEIGFPACDASSKEPAYLTLGFGPEITSQAQKASGKLSKFSTGTKQKAWLPANFRLEIAGLDCKKVSKIDAFTIKQAVATSAIGEQRDYEKEPGQVEFPNLAITFSEASAQTWIDWHEDFVIKGNNEDGKEKSGTLTFLSSNLKEELGKVSFFNLGIFRYTTDKGEANADAIKRITAELYCERMSFSGPKGGSVD